MPIEKFAYIVPMPGQGKRVMKSKLLTALGATGPNRPYTANPEHILERKILLQTPFNYNPSSPVTPVVPSNTLLNNLVHYYDFEAFNGSNGINDKVGTLNTTSFNAGADLSINAGGIITKCVACTGAGTNNGLLVNAPTVLDIKALNAGDGSLTISIWAWLDLAGAQTAGFPMLASVYGAAGGSQYWICFVSNGSSVPIWRMINSVGVAVDISWGAGISRQAWHLFVMGYDGTLGKTFLSVDNGALIYSAAFTPRALSNNGDFCFFQANSQNNEWAGRADECGIWSGRALTQANISSVWNGGAALPLSSFTA